MKWLPPSPFSLLSGGTGEALEVGGGGVLGQQKSFPCCVQQLDLRLVGFRGVSAAVNPSNSHGNTELSQTMT